MKEDPIDLDSDAVETGAVMWLDWYGASQNTPLQFANQMIVQNHEGMVYVSFFTVKPPVTMGNREEVLHQMAGRDRLVPDCAARLIVTPKFARDMLQALKGHLDKMETDTGDDDANN